MNSQSFLKGQFALVVLLCLILFSSCKNSSTRETVTNDGSQGTIQVEEPLEINEVVVNQELLVLEAEYMEMLAPILLLKTSHSEIYWFIVSWLNTAYRTPNWKGYYSEEWMLKSKQNGIDCSGFSRVMLDQMFDQQVAGSSQGLLDRYCTPVGLTSLEMGDLVFFRAPYATSDRIVHVGVYLQDDYFVHATSTKSAAKGLGLSVNSLQEENWAEEFVSGGKVKD